MISRGFHFGRFAFRRLACIAILAVGIKTEAAGTPVTSIQLDDGAVVLSRDGIAVIEKASRLEGPYSIIKRPIFPWREDIAELQLFFRVTDLVGTSYEDEFSEAIRPFTSLDWSEKYEALTNLVQGNSASLSELMAGLKMAHLLDESEIYTKGWIAEQVGRHCAIALARLGEPSALPVLLSAYDHPDRETRREIIRAVAALNDPEAVAALLHTLEDPTEDLTNKRDAAIGLTRFGPAVVTPLANLEVPPDRVPRLIVIAALAKLAMSHRDSVEAAVNSAENQLAKDRLSDSLAEVDHRLSVWGEPPLFTEVADQAAESLSQQDPESALEAWETVVDSGLYSPDDEMEAREHILVLKNQYDLRLSQPLARWKNKVFILQHYDADLLDENGQVVDHVNYALSDEEVGVLRERFAVMESTVEEGALGALDLQNDITVVEEPWHIFQPSFWTPERYQISRSDLNEAFDYREQYLAGDYDCVFFVYRCEPGVFVSDGGFAGLSDSSVLNNGREFFETIDITAHCHEWLHMFQYALDKRGQFDWLQVVELHDQIRDARLKQSWLTGRNVLQDEIFVEIMQMYVTRRMWACIGNGN